MLNRMIPLNSAYCILLSCFIFLLSPASAVLAVFLAMNRKRKEQPAGHRQQNPRKGSRAGPACFGALGHSRQLSCAFVEADLFTPNHRAGQVGVFSSTGSPVHHSPTGQLLNSLHNHSRAISCREPIPPLYLRQASFAL